MTEVVFTNDFLAALALREGGTITISTQELEAAPRQVRITHGARGTDYTITTYQRTTVTEETHGQHA